MIKSKHLILVLVPAIIIVGLTLFVRILQYEPLFPDAADVEEIQKKISEQIIPIYSDDPILGNKKGITNIIIFEDFGCEACREQSSILKQLLNKHSEKIRIVWKGLPVTKFPYSSELAHSYSYCANEQGKFIEFKDYAFANLDNLTPEILTGIAKKIEIDQNKLQTCLDKKDWQLYFNKNTSLAKLLGIQEVPTTFINNLQIKNPQSAEEWESILNL